VKPRAAILVRAAHQPRENARQSRPGMLVRASSAKLIQSWTAVVDTDSLPNARRSATRVDNLAVPPPEWDCAGRAPFRGARKVDIGASCAEEMDSMRATGPARVSQHFTTKSRYNALGNAACTCAYAIQRGGRQTSTGSRIPMPDHIAVTRALTSITII
jgi:hypothetical protein